MARILEPEILQPGAVPEDLDRAGAVLYSFPGYVDLARNWLDAGLAKRYIAVRLLAGSIRRGADEGELPEEFRRIREAMEPVSEIFENAQDVPVGRLSNTLDVCISVLSKDNSRIAGIEDSSTVVSRFVRNISWSSQPPARKLSFSLVSEHIPIPVIEMA